MAAITMTTAFAAYDYTTLGLRRRMSTGLLLRPSSLETNTSLKLTRCSSTTEDNTDVFFVTPLTKADFDYLGQSTKGDLNLNIVVSFRTLEATHMDDKELIESIQKLLIVMQRLDDKIAPLLESDGELFNKRWGFLSRAGLWDKSHLMRQIEKYADIYTSMVSNFLHYTPFMCFRAQEQSLAHDSYSLDQRKQGESAECKNIESAASAIMP